MKVDKIFGNAFIIACMFPWLSFRLNDLDSQPWTLLLGGAFILLNYTKKKIEHETIIILTLIPISLLSAFGNANFTLDFTLVRALTSYTTFVIVIIGTYVFYKKYGIPIKLIISSNFIYLLVALIQELYDPYIFDFLTTVRTTENRGVTSLTPEPTFFAIHLFFLSFIYILYYNYIPPKKINILITINILMILLLAKSTTALLFVFIFSFFILIRSLNYKIIVYIALMSILSSVVILFYLDKDTRIYNMIFSFFSSGLFVTIEEDASANSRFNSLIIPILGFLDANGLPSGFHAFLTENNKINSYFGTFLFELGFLGVLYFISIAAIIYKKSKKSVIDLFFLLVITNSAIPVAYPLIPAIIATLIFKPKRYKFFQNQP